MCSGDIKMGYLELFKIHNMHYSKVYYICLTHIILSIVIFIEKCFVVKTITPADLNRLNRFPISNAYSKQAFLRASWNLWPARDSFIRMLFTRKYIEIWIRKAVFTWLTRTKRKNFKRICKACDVITFLNESFIKAKWEGKGVDEVFVLLHPSSVFLFVILAIRANITVVQDC